MRTRYISLAFIFLLIAGCSSVFVSQDSAPRNPPRDLASVPNAVPKVEPVTKAGNPSTYVVRGKRYYTKKSSKGFIQRGVASWYGTKFHGRKTSNGERYDMYAMTAAHKTLPIPTYVEVTNLHNGKKIIVRVNDRGPFESNRIIDLSYTAAHKLGILGKGTGLVEIRAIDPRTPESDKPVQVRAPEPATPVATSLYLQVGAFSERTNAEELRSWLQTSLESGVKVDSVDQKKQPLYRVKVGPIETVEEIDRLSGQLASLGIKTPQVIID
ncbi:MAG: septal ring lytic transglycosylase RlpA family protein [Gammaproteobacteria bacterium]|nr:septal ring lytic transglycosylase RlpA family protein [Gammaproteobacteria bacterium]MDH5594900.1 septal ring lytic transglycosylase RlpA family protein [Gammaproteobacteria bacterium]